MLVPTWKRQYLLCEPSDSHEFDVSNKITIDYDSAKHHVTFVINNGGQSKLGNITLPNAIC